MNKIGAIQVVVDPMSHAQPGVEKAAMLAAKFDARVELLLCDTTAARQLRSVSQYSAKNRGEPLREPKELIDSLVASLREQRLEVSSQIDFADPLHEALLKHIRKGGADFVVKDTHHHSFLKRTFLTNTDWHLIRGCSVPLLLAKATSWKLPPTIMAAIDPAHVNDKPATLDRQLLEWGALLSQKLRGPLHVAHAFIPASLVAASTAAAMTPIVGICTPEMMQTETAARMEQIRSLTGDFKIDDTRIHLEVGSATDLLPKLTAELMIDILITGAISRSAIARAFIGSTAEQILERTSCDVLVVKALDFAEDLPF